MELTGLLGRPVVRLQVVRFRGKVSEGSFHLFSQKDGGARVVFLEL